MKRSIAWAALLVLPLGLGADGAAQQPKSGGTLRVAWGEDVTGFDPHGTSGLQVTSMAGNLFNHLVTIDANLNYMPELAESCEEKDHGKVYVFKRRRGVKFHDGTGFDAALHASGTGPFKLAKWEPNQVIVLEQTPDHYKPGLPYLDRFETSWLDK